MITYADVQRIYRTESNTPMLGEIPEDFYEQMPKLLSQVEPPHGSHILKFVNEIYIKRRNKIILHALRICDKENTPVNATPSEKELYISAVELMKKHNDQSLNPSLDNRRQEPENTGDRKIKIRMLKPMPSIVGSDLKNYGPLKEDDILELPEDNAMLLIRGEYARKYEETKLSADEE